MAGERVALVTGAAAGIGPAAAEAFAARPDAVVVVDLPDRGGAEAARAIRDRGGRALLAAADVADEAEAAGGAIVNCSSIAGCAGSPARAPTSRASTARWA